MIYPACTSCEVGLSSFLFFNSVWTIRAFFFVEKFQLRVPFCLFFLCTTKIKHHLFFFPFFFLSCFLLKLLQTTTYLISLHFFFQLPTVNINNTCSSATLCIVFFCLVFCKASRFLFHGNNNLLPLFMWYVTKENLLLSEK